MKIEAKHLLAQPEGTTETHQISLSNLVLSEDSTANISGNATLTSLEDFILANIVAKADITLPCHRCLKPANIHMDLDFSIQFYHPSIPPLTKGRLGEARRSSDRAKTGGVDESEDYLIIDDQINLATPIKDEIIANLPIKVLCKDDCGGICSVCGNNLNDNPCKCDKVEFEVSNKIRFENGSTTEKEN